MPDHIPYIRVFLSSPGDVNEERKIAQDVIERLPYRPALRDQVAFRVIAWDKLGADTPMLASKSPQEAIDLGLPKPSDCDIVIVIFWSRMGTPFIYNGTKYLSGTHYELMDALNASGTETLIFRRSEEKRFAADDKRGWEQYQRVEQFFQSDLFHDSAQGIIRRGVNLYRTPDEFRQKFETYLEELTFRQLKKLEASPIRHEASGTIAPELSAHVRDVRAERWQGSPFPGLRAFTEADVPIYFGRGAETDALVRLIADNRFVAVMGASGSGKSSLVGAGLIPRLRANAISGPTFGSKDWLYVRFKPGEADSPFEALFDALVETFPSLRPPPLEYPQSRHAFVEELQRDPKSLLVMLEQTLKAIHAPAWSEVLLFIDQFEELLTLANTHIITPFVKLLQAAAASARVRIIVTMRADFYARAVEIQGLAQLLEESTYTLGTPNILVLQEMVVGPADIAGLTFEKGLVELILGETGNEPGALALLAFLLDELYKKGASDGVLTLDEYKSLGGVRGAIGKRAEEVVKDLSPETQAALPRLFREIVEVDARGRATRRRALLARLDDEALYPALRALTEARLLVTDEGEARAPTLEVAHEALLREWERLAAWITEAQADLLLRRQIEHAARDWQAALDDQKNAYVLVGGRLIEAQRWAQTQAAGTLEQDFIKASTDHQVDLQAQDERRKQELLEAARRARNARLTAGGVALIALILILFAALVSFTAQQSAAESQRAAFQANAAANTASTQVAVAQATLTPIRGTLNASYLTNADAAFVDSQPAQAAYLALQVATGYAPEVDNILLQAYNSMRNVHGHTHDVSSVAFSPNGRYALTGSWDGTAQLWDVSSGQTVRVLRGHLDRLNSVAFSPDGRYALTGSYEKTARLWDVSTGQTVRVLSGHMHSVSSVAFSPNGRYVLTGSYDGTARLWDVSSGQTVRVLSESRGMYAIIVAFSPDGRYALTGSAEGGDGTIRLWDVSTGQTVRVFSGHTTSLNSVAFSPDGRYILTGSSDATARLWDVSTGQIVRVFSGPMDSVTSVAFSPDGRYVLIGGSDATARLWDVSTRQIVRVLSGHISGVTSVAFSPDGRYALTSSIGLTTRLWDVSSGQALRGLSRYMDPDMSVAFSPDSRYALTGSSDGTAQLWDVSTGQTLRVLSGHTASVNSVDFSPDGRYILTGSSDGTAQLWDVSTGQTLRVFSGHTTSVNSVDFSPDGRYILTGSSDGTAQLWDVSTGQIVRVFSGHTTSVSSVAFSPDGRYVLTGGVNYTARLWDVSTGQTVRVLSGQFVDSVTFSPDGRYALTGGWDGLAPTGSGTARLWDISTGQTVRVLSGHPYSVSSVAFSPDGRYALTGSSDGTARLWELSSGREIRRIMGHLLPWLDSLVPEVGGPSYETFIVSVCGVSAPKLLNQQNLSAICPNIPSATPTPTLDIIVLDIYPTLPPPSATPIVSSTATDSARLDIILTPSMTMTLAMESVYTAMPIASPTVSDSPTPTLQVTLTPSLTSTAGPPPTWTLTPSNTPGPSPTYLSLLPAIIIPTSTPTSFVTLVFSTPAVSTPLASPTITNTPSGTYNATFISPTPTRTQTPGQSPTATATPTIIFSGLFTPLPTLSDTPVVTGTPIYTPGGPTLTPTITLTYGVATASVRPD